MIHEISPHRFNNQFIPNKSIGETDFVFHYRLSSLLLKTHGEDFLIPRKSDFPEISDRTSVTFLFTLDDVPCFLVWDDLAAEEPGFIYREISLFRNVKKQEIAWAGIAGFHLKSWYEQNRFCGKCGSRTVQRTDEREIVCPECNTVFYPKISPAIIVAITCNDKILLAHNSKFTGNWYSLIAGYVDVGETLEGTVRREVKEEVGLDLSNIRYYKSQPWPVSFSMMIGFIAEADENQPIILDPKEISDAKWFSRGHLPEIPSTISIAGEMIRKFENGEL